MPRFFISYAKKDTHDLAFALADALATSRNVTTWMDRDLRVVDSAFSQQIEREIQQCDFMIVLLSPDVDRPFDLSKKQRESYVRTEIRYMAEECGKKEQIIPVMVSSSGRPIAIELAAKQRIDFTNRSTQNPNDFGWLVERICTEAGIETPEPYRSQQAHLRAEEENRRQAELQRQQAAQIEEAKRLAAQRQKVYEQAQPIQRKYAAMPTTTSRLPWRVLTIIGLIIVIIPTATAAMNVIKSWQTPTCTSLAQGTPDSRVSAIPNFADSRVALEIESGDIHQLTMLDVGTGTTVKLTDDAFDNIFPSWSPDGQSIAFQTNRDGNKEIYRLDIATHALTNLTNNSATDVGPFWSPDGRLIAWQSKRDGNWDVYVMNVDGSNPRRLTENASQDAPTGWNSTSTQLLVASDRSGSWGVYRLTVDTKEIVPVLTSFADNTPPIAMQSLDDKLIVVTKGTGDGKTLDTAILNSDGTAIRALGASTGYDGIATWLPDSQHIVFATTRDGTLQIPSLKRGRHFVVTTIEGQIVCALDQGEADYGVWWSKRS